MPQLIFKGVKREEVAKASEDLALLLADVSNTPVDYFTFERPNTEYFSGGKTFEMYPLIEVKLFDRGKDIESKMAEIIQNKIKGFGYDVCEVYFTHIGLEDYYE